MVVNGIDLVRSGAVLAVLLGALGASLGAQGVTTWQGGVSSAWDDAANWSNGTPVGKTAIIPAGTPNAPSTLGQSVACQHLSIAAGATLTVPGGTLTVSQSLSRNGAAGAGVAAIVGGGTVRVSGYGSISGGAGLQLPNLEVAGIANGTYSMFSNIAVAGNLTLTSGKLTIGGVAVVTVAGNAQFTGGTMPYVHANGTPGVIDVEGDVTFSGCAASPRAIIQCAGNWTADEMFVANASFPKVWLDGATATTLTATGPNSRLHFAELRISGGSRSFPAMTRVRPLTLWIAPGGVLDIGSETLILEYAGSVSNQGLISVGAGGNLACGPGLASVYSAGSLSLIGSPSEPATVRADGGGLYSLTVGGPLAAQNFEFRDLKYPVSLMSTCTVAAAPNDVRAGRFDFGVGAQAGSYLLRTYLAVPATFDYLVFDNTPGIAGAKNVNWVSGGNITLTNSLGVLGGVTGDLHDSDGYDVGVANHVIWPSPTPTIVSSFTATGASSSVDLAFTTSSEGAVSQFWVERGTAAGGPFTVIKTFAAIGPATYAFTDTGPLVAGQTYHYRLRELLIQGVLNVLATASAVPIAGAPVIATQPRPGSSCPGGNLVFWVIATGAPPLNYQWFRAPATPVGSNLPTLQLTGVLAADEGSYYVTVTNAVGSATSSSATLNVIEPAVITTQPTSMTACPGAPVTLSLVATGEQLRYQWYRNGRRVGGNSASYAILNPGLNHAGTYYCRVANGCASLQSATVTLVVKSVPAITQQPPPLPASTCAGGPLSLTVGATGTPPLAYQWYENGVAVGGATAANVTIPAPGTLGLSTYHCEVTNSCGGVTSASVATMVVPGSAPAISVQPASTALIAGTPGGLSVTATGSSPLAYQWRRDGVPILGSTLASLPIAAADLSVAGTYDVVVSNGCGAVTSAPAIVTVSGPAVVTQHPASQFLCLGEPVTLSTAATGGGPFTITLERNGAPIASTVGTSLVHTIAAMAPADAGAYRFRFDGGGTAYSAPATLAAPIERATAPAPSDVACADLSAPLDGDVDIAVASGGDSVAIHLNEGAGAFAAPATVIPLSAGDQPSAIAAGDFSSGGDVDLAVACAGSNALKVLVNAGGWIVGPALTLPFQHPVAMAAGDVDQISGTDLVIACDGGTIGVGGVVFVSGGGVATPMPALAPSVSSVRGVALGDLDNNGKVDVVAAVAPSVFGGPGVYPSHIAIFRNIGAAFAAPQLVPLAEKPRGVAVRDVDGDGKLDIVVTVESYPFVVPGGVRVLLTTGTSQIIGNPLVTSFITPLMASGLVPADIAAADLRSDGLAGFNPREDAVTVNLGSGDIAIHEVFSGTAFGTPRYCAAGTNPVAVAAARLDSDALVDFVAASHSSGTITLFEYSADQVIQSFGNACPGASGTSPTLSVVGSAEASLATVTVRLDGGVPNAPATLRYAPTRAATTLGSGCVDYVGAGATNLASTTDGLGRTVFQVPVSAFGGAGGTLFLQSAYGPGLDHQSPALRVTLGQ
jgi:hypothetical protein